ncbi:hypothetical protein ACQ4M4_25555 [Leptolyngbya sp. AN02str]|uniref:hypothetical protein n=1 Tax=Leptolyngbya sp. AN02str TaxID=3423363 RepID=UPI003D320CF9
MNPLQKYFGALALASVLSLSTAPEAAHALSVTRLPYTLNSGAVPRLDVSPHWGLALSFLQTGERIQQWHVGDISRIVIATDAPLPEASGGQKDEGLGAHILFLRMLSHRLEMDLRLPASARQSNRMPLTINTVDAAGRQRTYLFELVLGAATDVGMIEIVHPQPAAPSRQFSARPAPTTNVSEANHTPISPELSAAMERAVSNGLLVRDGEAWTRTHQAAQYISAGYSIEEAATQAGIAPLLVQRIFGH